MKTNHLETQIAMACEIMGEKNVFGPKKIETAFQTKIYHENMPVIPFSKAELKRAAELNQFLVLRTDYLFHNQALTMEVMENLLRQNFEDQGYGKIIYSVNWPEPPMFNSNWYKKEDFFTKETPRFSWALSSKNFIPESLGEDYLTQNEILVEYLRDTVFLGQELPSQYQRAVDELLGKKEMLKKLIELGEIDHYAEEFKNLTLHLLTRQSPVESLYDTLVYFQNNQERLLDGAFAWTNYQVFNDYYVYLGNFSEYGITINKAKINYSSNTPPYEIGVIFSRIS